MGRKTESNNFKDENLNPCFDEGKLSLKCLKENYYNSEKCVHYFENYKKCLQYWGTVKRLRINNNIRPFIPDKDERKKILEEREKGNNVYQAR